jgi:LysR family transcriptional regulator, glycine cleavage system transcriptional activator
MEHGASQKLPSLNALRAFEAAARHLSFTRAAAELHVTQAAISHQIKALENDLGVRLFTRANRALTLTEAGAAYAADVRDAFDRLTRATGRLVPRNDGAILTVSVSPANAGHWLIPRLHRFRAAHPEISVRLNVTGRVVDLQQEDVDCAIRHRHDGWNDLHAVLLARQSLIVVCSPTLLNGRKKLRCPADLVHYALLREPEVDWEPWLIANGVADPDTTRCIVIDDHGMVIEAAVAGQGVALARDFLVADKLASRVLIKPFEITPPPDSPDFDYYLVCRKAAVDQPKITAFHDWTMKEAAATVIPSSHPIRAGSASGRARAARRWSGSTDRAPGRDDESGG